jgi:hypothetical protein
VWRLAKDPRGEQILHHQIAFGELQTPETYCLPTGQSQAWQLLKFLVNAIAQCGQPGDIHVETPNSGSGSGAWLVAHNETLRWSQLTEQFDSQLAAVAGYAANS